MKVAITNTVSIQDILITVENTVFALVDMIPVLNNFTASRNAAGNAWIAWLDCPFTVQAVGATAGASTMQVIDDRGMITCKNFIAANLNRFTAGKNYLVRYEDGVTTDILPGRFGTQLQGGVASTPSVIAGPTNSTVGSDTFISSRRYLYTAMSDFQVRTAAAISVIQFDYDNVAALENNKAKLQRKQGEVASYAATIAR